MQGFGCNDVKNKKHTMLEPGDPLKNL